MADYATMRSAGQEIQFHCGTDAGADRQSQGKDTVDDGTRGEDCWAVRRLVRFAQLAVGASTPMHRLQRRNQAKDEN
jgi:hypothetical protein